MVGYSRDPQPNRGCNVYWKRMVRASLMIFMKGTVEVMKELGRLPESVQTRILLAYSGIGCKGVCVEVPKISGPCKYPSDSRRNTSSNWQPLTLLPVEARHLWPIPKSNRVTKIYDCDGGSLQQVGRGRGGLIYYNLASCFLCYQEHLHSIWYF